MVKLTQMYPKTIVLKDTKLQKLLEEKKKYIEQGIEISKEIEDIETQMQAIDEKIQAVEKTVGIDDLKAKEQEVTKRLEDLVVQMENIKQEVFDRMKEKAPSELYTQYDALITSKQKKEEDRNKVAIKVQKYNEKAIPLGKKLVAPYLTDMFDDYDTIKMEEGEIKVTIFNSLEDFKKNFKKK